MAIKIPFSQAKRLGFVIKGYVFSKEKTTPQPIIAKKDVAKREKKKQKRNIVKLKEEGLIVRLDLDDLQGEKDDK